ncbi:MAG: type I-C CRISPR-associated protein Cas8c/Csd1 [Proteobacteria bacterium]|nr:type I-C CRISPR-associated protein Cas8c/Csd1 [Desulfobulbaceae bacterium]MBU4152762.1 type I-C CRISPR-associated protein Cas8c/Csd1 [Pseudomonadota bacterium]
MSWIEKLYQTYENNRNFIGNRNDKSPLLPICHTTQNAHVAVIIDGSGNFIAAEIVPKSDAMTIVPASEESSGRTGQKPVCHPLCDKLQYIAGDFTDFGGEVTCGFSAKPREPHNKYVEQLSIWNESAYCHRKVSAILRYVKKKTLISDLVSVGVLHVKSSLEMMYELLNEWTANGSSPAIFKILPGGVDKKGQKKPCQGDAFVRWIVEEPEVLATTTWEDPSLWQSWSDFYGSLKSNKGVCYVTGKEQFLAAQHPKKIRNGGDGAKLISSNDTVGYTFLGRFTSADEACCISFDVTQKAHSALRWLIARQGFVEYVKDEGSTKPALAVVAWAVSGVDIPDPLVDTFALLSGDEQAPPLSKTGYTAQAVGIALSKKMAGYRAHLRTTDDIVVIGLDSATPGRMAISYYREMLGSEFLARIEAWHTGCCWQQYFGKDRIFFGAPAPRDIAEVAFGWRIDDKLRKSTIERLLPCVVDGASIPRDIVESCIRRASNRNGIEYWQWEKALGIACALYKKLNEKEEYSMALDQERNSRDYLYGRLLALAEHLEGRALYLGGEHRATGAEKLMQRFADHPFSTWRILETGLTPYKVRLGAKRPGFLHAMQQEIDAVCCLFATDDFVSDMRLTGEFLLGYHCQRSALKPQSSHNQVDSTDESEDTEE